MGITNEIYDHDSKIDVTHKINSTELNNWINHLKYIKKELNNFIGLYGKDLSNAPDDGIIAKFQEKDAENDLLLKALNKYNSSRGDIRECEDTECDMIYITEHESYRRSYLYHLDKYRTLKDEFFNKVLGKCTLIKTKS